MVYLNHIFFKYVYEYGEGFSILLLKYAIFNANGITYNSCT